MKVVAAVLAGGSGARFGADKALIPLRGRPLWKWSFDALREHPDVSAVGVVCSESNLAAIQKQANGALFVAVGGSTRQQSSRVAAEQMPADTEIAVIHDAARPFASRKLISDVIAAAARSGAAAPGAPVSDTLREISASGSRIVDRDRIVAMQTPQGARYDLLLRAHREAKGEATEELALLEAVGVRPEIVEGETTNFKVTFEEDLLRAAALLGPAETRMGIGYDAHAFSKDPKRPLWLGGVHFEGETGLEGHSDADALLHALVDALLGAAGLGDIGRHFPDTDPSWRNEPSLTFVRFAARQLEETGWRPVNCDATVIAERPRIAGRAGEMQGAIAETLGIERERINIKATTNEKMGAIGRGEGIAAFVVASIRQSP